jgi:Leucine-rich repeat (LRR) protein
MSKQIKEAKKGETNKLTLDDTKITKDVIDKIIVSLPLLVELRIVSCKLSSVPLEFAKLTQLKYFNLEENLVGTKIINFSFVNLADELPYNLPPNITTIVLSRNKFSTFPCPLLYLPFLSHITLDHNNLKNIDIVVDQEKVLNETQEISKKETAPRRLTLFGRKDDKGSQNNSLIKVASILYLKLIVVAFV